MTNVGNQPGYPYGTTPPEPRPASSWLWPALLGVGMVIAAGLVLLVALQLTDGGDDSIGTADTTSTTSTASTSSTTAPAPTTSTPTSTTVVDTTSPSTPTSALPTPAPTVAAPPAPTVAPPTASPEPTVTTAVAAGGSCAAYTPDGSIPVRRCASGPLVAEIQNALRGVGFSIEADGFFGPGTEAAVLDFQASRGLEQDGIVGPDTYDALTG